MCEYCDGSPTALMHDFQRLEDGGEALSVGLYVVPNGEISICIGYAGTDVWAPEYAKIHYCPMCGRKLEE